MSHTEDERIEAEAQAVSAEARAAQLEQDLQESGAAYTAKAYTVSELSRIVSEVTDERDELRSENITLKFQRDAALSERDRANQGFAALSKEYDKAMTRLAALGEKVTA